ncbi:MAG: hypothetical protein JHD25_05085 [Sphingomonadaceae bacterium]|jgi:hypothetical protein|nr:hypothetical protein [Sphingomonadaceae bacterium]
MASAPPHPAPISRDQMVHWVKLAIGGVVSALAGGFFAALFTYSFTAKLNTEAALQQQYLAAAQDFNATGARVDAAITELSDNVLDSTDVAQAKREARQTIAAHVAATQALSPVIGTGNAEAYMEGLATLRVLVDKTGDASAALKTSRARFDLMDNRQIMLAEARRRIYGEPSSRS